MLHRWRKGGKPTFVSDEVWQSWQHQWNDASFQSIRERQSRIVIVRLVDQDLECNDTAAGPYR